LYNIIKQRSHATHVNRTAPATHKILPHLPRPVDIPLLLLAEPQDLQRRAFEMAPHVREDAAYAQRILRSRRRRSPEKESQRYCDQYPDIF